MTLQNACDRYGMQNPCVQDIAFTLAPRQLMWLQESGLQNLCAQIQTNMTTCREAQPDMSTGCLAGCTSSKDFQWAKKLNARVSQVSIEYS